MNTTFNIRGGDLYLVVGQQQTPVRAHSHFFIRESEWWKKELLGPEPSADAPLRKGNSPTNAYPLRDELPEDFRLLLGIFYNTAYGNYSHVTTAHWITILRYTIRWGFKEVQALAIRCLENHHMDIAQRIALYQRNKVPNKYILPYYIQLASRPEGLELEECRVLGYKNLWFLHHARDDLHARQSSQSAGSLNDIDSAEIANIIKTAYIGTIKNMDPIAGSSTKDQTERPAEDVENEDERGESDAGSWEDVDGDSDEKWENLSIPGSFC